MLVAITIGMVCYLGQFGEVAQALAHFITLGVALATAPLIAVMTGSKYYIARPAPAVAADSDGRVTCCVCENRFDVEDMTGCPAYAGNICSLCCSLDSRCGDLCKPGGSYVEQSQRAFEWLLPRPVMRHVNSGLAQFTFLLVLINGLIGAILALIYFQSPTADLGSQELLAGTLWKVFFVLMIITGVLSWLFVLANESRRAAQEESNRQNRRLLDGVEAHEVTDKELQQAKERAESANQAKNRYLTGISHELRSPLNAVVGYAQLLEKDPQIPVERRPALDVIRRSGEYLADLIEGLLDISKIEAGRLELHYTDVRMDLLLDQLVHMFQLQAEERGLEFRFSYVHRVPRWVRADEKRVRQILINLLTNAMKYTEKGYVSFSVNYRGGVTEFTVEDTGEGIASDDMERVFRPFERVRNPGSTAPGTGLGLTITKLLCEIMGGEITVESTPGRGSRFRVALLLSALHGHPEYQAVDRGQVPRGYQGPRRRILVVDDENSHRQLMVEMFSPLGFDVTALSDATQAKTWLQSQPVDLILLDLNMPGQDGCTLLRTLRGQGFAVPVVILSANAADANAQPDGPTLHDGFFTKPLQLNLLLEHIGGLLDMKWVFAPERSIAPAMEPAEAGVSLRAVLDPVLLQRLRDLTNIGHRKGILEMLYRMRDEHPQLGESLQDMIHLADTLQLQALRDLLREESDEVS